MWSRDGRAVDVVTCCLDGCGPSFDGKVGDFRDATLKRA